MLPEKLKWYLKHKTRVLTTLVIITRQSQQTEFVCKKVVSGGQFLSFQKTSVQMQGEKPQQSKPSAVRCVINTLLLHCNGTRALARLWNDLTSCQPLSYSPWMLIQDTAVTPRQHSVNTEVIIRDEPGTNSSTSHEEAGSLGQNQKDSSVTQHHRSSQPWRTFFMQPPCRLSLGLSHSVSPLRKEASWPKRSKSPSKESIPVVETRKCWRRPGGKGLKAAGLLAGALSTHRKPRTLFRGRLPSARRWEALWR